MASMKAYLAANYMSGAKADAILAHSSSSTGKKKKRRPVVVDAQRGGTTLIKDDDEETRWGKSNPQDEDDVMVDAVVEKSDRSFKKRKVEGESTGWITVKERSPVDEDPTVVEEEVKPSFGGGLVKASDLRSTLPQTSGPSKKGKEKEQPPPEELETVYRDSSGRKIDTKAEKAAAARERRMKEEKEAQKMEWGKGLVQRAEAEERRKEEERERTRGLARYADDADLNAHQKAIERWNDPAAAFLTKKEKKGPRKPMYNGPLPPPNRFGIPPGYRWDGVDRSNGFEKKMFQRANEKKRVGLEAYEWSVDDM